MILVDADDESRVGLRGREMTKTERAILEAASRKPRGTMCAMVWFSTSSRQGLCGVRAARAIKRLVEKGLASDLKFHESREANSDGWGTTHATEYCAKITNAGRKAIGDSTNGAI